MSFLKNRVYSLPSHSRGRVLGSGFQFCNGDDHTGLLCSGHLSALAVNSSSVDELFSCQLAFFLDDKAKIVTVCS